MNRLTGAALIALAATSALSIPALARTDPTGDAISTAASIRPIQFSLNTEPLLREKSTAEPSDLVRVAKKSKRKRKRIRLIRPARGLAETDGANAQAALDCSIQSHPDCQPKPTGMPVFDYDEDFAP